MASPVLIPEPVSLAVHALAVLAADRRGPVSLERLLLRPGSADHLSKVMQKLVKAGMVRSRRGRGGGFTIAVDPEDIRLMDIWIALEGTFESSICPFSGGGCSIPVCLFGSIGRDAAGIIGEYLSKTRLSDLVTHLKGHCDGQGNSENNQDR